MLLVYLCQTMMNVLTADTHSHISEINDIMGLCAFAPAQFTAADATIANTIVVAAAAPVGQDIDVPGFGNGKGKGKGSGRGRGNDRTRQARGTSGVKHRALRY